METTNRGNLGEQTQDQLGEKAGAVRARLESAIDRAKAACEQLQEKTVAAAKATDKTVHENPYPFIGVAFGIGLVVGALAMRSRRD